MLRRELLGLLACAAACRPAAASGPPGTAVTRELIDGVRALTGVLEGFGPTVDVVFTPWCHALPEFYKTTRSFSGRIAFNWIPYSGGQPEGRFGVQKLLSGEVGVDVAKSLVKVGTQVPVAPTPLSDRQDAALSALMHVYYRDVGGSLAIPTLFYSLPGDRYRVVRGEPGPADLEVIAQVAA